MKNLVKAKIERNEKVLGTFHEIGSATGVELLGYGGFDYVIVDTEHGPFDVESTQQFVRAAKGANITPFVRVKDGQRNSILKMLDVGAQGLIIPNIKTVEEVKELVDFGKYFPLGNRGVAPTSGSSFWTADYATQGLDHYFEVSNKESLIIPQCETRECLENIEEIVAVEGVDGIFVGPYDLSTALGKPGQFGDQEIIDAIQHISDVCKKAGKMAFIYAGDVETAKKDYEIGYDSVCFGMDAMILINAVKSIVKELE